MSYHTNILFNCLKTQRRQRGVTLVL